MVTDCTSGDQDSWEGGHFYMLSSYGHSSAQLIHFWQPMKPKMVVCNDNVQVTKWNDTGDHDSSVPCWNSSSVSWDRRISHGTANSKPGPMCTITSSSLHTAIHPDVLFLQSHCGDGDRVSDQWEEMCEEVWEQGTPARQNHTLRDLEISFNLYSTVS